MSNSSFNQGLVTRIYATIVLVAVVCVAFPFSKNYLGFEPAGSTKFTYPRLIILPYRRTAEMDGVHGLDFSQVFISSTHMRKGEPMYYEEDFKKYRRPWSSSYHPFTHFLYMPLTLFSFKTALITHNILQILIFLAASLMALRQFSLQRYFPWLASSILGIVFLTPVGVLHLERGQFDIYTATSYLLLFVFLLTKQKNWGIGAGIFSTIKVSAQPFVAILWSMQVAIEGKIPKKNMLILPITMMSVYVVFLKFIPSFLEATMAVETAKVGSVSLVRILPKTLVRILPFLITSVIVGGHFVCAERSKRKELFEIIFFPAALSICILSTGATSITHEYRLMGLLAFLPLLPIWIHLQPSMNKYYTAITAGMYTIMLLMIARTLPFTHYSYTDISRRYLIFAAIFFLIAIKGMIDFYYQNQKNTEQLD